MIGICWLVFILIYLRIISFFHYLSHINTFPQVLSEYMLRVYHKTIIWTAIICKKTIVRYWTPLAGGVLLQMLKHCEPMLNIFESSRLQETVKFWFAFANKFRWITQSYYLNSKIKRSYCQLLFCFLNLLAL